MMGSRRSVLGTGGVFLAGFMAPVPTRADEVVEIAMQANADGSDVWYDPIGLHLQLGQTIRWTNHDPGSAHTATAYHPQNAKHPCRIPKDAVPWHSDYLLPEQTFIVTLQVEGIYDYFCVPHEHAGMVGRIIVGNPAIPGPDSVSSQEGTEPILELALRAFPSMEEIMRKGIVRHRWWAD
jgi:plastocyanin